VAIVLRDMAERARVAMILSLSTARHGRRDGHGMLGINCVLRLPLPCEIGFPCAA
jgi:hypothetical protein